MTRSAIEQISEWRVDAERFAWLLEQPASVQDSVLRPPIPPELLETPEKWPDVVRAAIDERRIRK